MRTSPTFNGQIRHHLEEAGKLAAQVSDPDFRRKLTHLKSLALYMDVHVPHAVTTALRLRGIDVLTAQEDGSAELDDGPLLKSRPHYGLAR